MIWMLRENNKNLFLREKVLSENITSYHSHNFIVYSHYILNHYPPVPAKYHEREAGNDTGAYQLGMEHIVGV